MWESIKNYISTPEFAEYVDRAFEIMGSEPIAPIIDFLFYVIVVGPMILVDNVIIPITDEIGEFPFMCIVLMFFFIIYRRKNKKNQFAR